MKKIVKLLKIFSISILTLILSVGAVLSWNGLLADPGDMISISKWNELVNSVGGTIPYITTSVQQVVAPSTNKVITIDGENFTPTSVVLIPGFDGTINSTNVLSPSQLEVDITPGIAETDYDLVVSNNGKLNTDWSGNGVGLLHVGEVIGAGPAGTYNEDFESNTLGNWIEVTGLTANVSFQTITNGTPSANTGPNAAAGGTYYIFSEASSPNYPNMTFSVETDYFRKAQTISFDYHMFGADMGVLVVQTHYDGTWTDAYTLSGQQQVNQTDAWLNTGNIDLSSYQADKIRVFYTSGANFTGDASIDNIVITSI